MAETPGHELETIASRKPDVPKAGLVGTGARPRPLVALAWGSISTKRTWWPHRAKASARQVAVVVFPTPPFWLATQRIEGIGVIRSKRPF